MPARPASVGALGSATPAVPSSLAGSLFAASAGGSVQTPPPVVGPARVGDARGARLMLRRRLGLAHDPALTLERARTARVPGA